MDMIGWMFIIVGIAISIAAAIGWCVLKINQRDEIHLEYRRRLLGDSHK